MPELPEAETMARQLRTCLQGKRITSVAIDDRKVARPPLEHAAGRSIRTIQRRAKMIVFTLDKGRYIVFRLGMTGHFHFLPSGVQPDEQQQKYQVMHFRFDDGSLLIHSSIRRFGSVCLLSAPEFRHLTASLGPEPLSLSYLQFHACSKHERIPQLNPY